MGGPGGRGEPWRAGADLQYSTVQYSTVQYSGGPALTSHLNTPLVSAATLLRMMWVGVEWPSTCTVQYSIVQYSTVQHLQPGHQEHRGARVLGRDVPGVGGRITSRGAQF